MEHAKLLETLPANLPEALVAAIGRGVRLYGDEFDPSILLRYDPDIQRQIGSDQRVRVQRPNEPDRTGLVRMSTGAKPVLFLKPRANAIGSSDVLSMDDRIIGYQRRGEYVNE